VVKASATTGLLAEGRTSPGSLPTSPVSERQALVSNIGWSAIASLLTIVGRFTAGVVIARMLGPGRAGTLMYVLWIADFMLLVSSGAIPYVAVRFIADLNGQGREAASAAVSAWLYRRYLWLSGAGAAMSTLIAWRVAAPDQANLIAACLGLHFVGLALHTYYLAYLAGHQEFRTSARIAVLSTVTLVAGVCIGTIMWDVPGALLGYVAGSIPGAVGSVRCLGTVGQAGRIPTDLRTRLIKYALYTWISAIVAGVTWTRTEVFFIQRYVGEYWVAMFTVGISLSTLATQGPLLLTGALVPHFAQLAGAGRLDVLRGRYGSALRILALLLFPMCLGLSSLIPVLLPFIYGREFVAAVPSTMVMVAFSALAFATVGAATAQALELAFFTAAAGTIGAIVAIVAGFVVIPGAGVWGAAWSRVTIQGGLVAAGAIYLSRYYRCRFPVRDLILILLAAAGCAACSWAIVSTSGQVGSILVAVPASALVYAVAVRVFRIVKPEDVQLLRELVVRLPAPVVPYVFVALSRLTGQHLVVEQHAHDRPLPASPTRGSV
jgi:O-antigen/teichoic acid export membrane protein